MDKSKSFRNLRFERQAWFLNPRLIAIGITLALLSLAWLIIPVGLLFFFLLLPVAGLVWAASYGWRQALAVLLGWLRRLEQL